MLLTSYILAPSSVAQDNKFAFEWGRAELVSRSLCDTLMSKGASSTILSHLRRAGRRVLVLANCTITIPAGSESYIGKSLGSSSSSVLYSHSLALEGLCGAATLPPPPSSTHPPYTENACYYPLLCTLADAQKTRQTEYYTNTHHRFSLSLYVCCQGTCLFLAPGLKQAKIAPRRHLALREKPFHLFAVSLRLISNPFHEYRIERCSPSLISLHLLTTPRTTHTHTHVPSGIHRLPGVWTISGGRPGIVPIV